jgi:hypothetical protein
MNQEDEYFDTTWTPLGYDKKEWQIIWRKLWLLSRDEIKNLADKLGTRFTDKKTQEKGATKSDFILLIDDGVDKNDLLNELDLILKKKKIIFDKNLSDNDLIKKLDGIRKKRGL